MTKHEDTTQAAGGSPLERGVMRLEPERAAGGAQDFEDHDDQDEAHCFDCGELHDMCECHIGEE